MLTRSESRRGARVRVLAVHTTEGIMRAVDLRAWQSWAGSSHAAADDTGVLLDGDGDGFVDHDRASWTLRSGNPWSENIELCAMAGWTRAQWLARPKLLNACARWLAARSVARDIPLVKLTPAQYRAGGSGVIGHHDHTVGYSDGTHWDPGPGFPWDVVLALARTYATPGGFLMALSDAEQTEALGLLRQISRALPTDRPAAVAAWQHQIGGPVETATGSPQETQAVLADVFAHARASVALLSQLAARPGVAVTEVAAELLPSLTELLRTLPQVDVAAFAKAAADEADRRARDGDPATGPVT